VLTLAVERLRRALSAGAEPRCRGLSTTDGFAITHLPFLSWLMSPSSVRRPSPSPSAVGFLVDNNHIGFACYSLSLIGVGVLVQGTEGLEVGGLGGLVTTGVGALVLAVGLCVLGIEGFSVLASVEGE
jgi:hypothetical protein